MKLREKRDGMIVLLRQCLNNNSSDFYVFVNRTEIMGQNRFLGADKIQHSYFNLKVHYLF